MPTIFLGVITGLDPIAVRKNGVASLAYGSRLGTQCLPKRDGRVKPGHDEGEDLRAKRSSIVKQPDTFFVARMDPASPCGLRRGKAQ
jgi:hypothetical protein